MFGLRSDRIGRETLENEDEGSEVEVGTYTRVCEGRMNGANHPLLGLLVVYLPCVEAILVYVISIGFVCEAGHERLAFTLFSTIFVCRRRVHIVL
jgi:hypothetical protein